MGVISEAYAMRRLNEFIKSDAGKAKLAQIRKDLLSKGIGGGSGALSKERAQEIIHNICEEFKIIVREVIPSFRLEAIHTEVEGFDNQGYLRANISVDEDALRRESLHYMNKNLSIGHGEGVDDILALFAHGYTINKRPYGFWVRAGGNSMTRIGARMHRDPNPFLTDFVNKLNAEYAGQCAVTLKDKYRTQGGG